MPTEPDLREELADERRELKQAVASLRGELGKATTRGKKLAKTAGAAAGVVLTLRMLLRRRRRR